MRDIQNNQEQDLGSGGVIDQRIATTTYFTQDYLRIRSNELANEISKSENKYSSLMMEKMLDQGMLGVDSYHSTDEQRNDALKKFYNNSFIVWGHLDDLNSKERASLENYLFRSIHGTYILSCFMLDPFMSSSWVTDSKSTFPVYLRKNSQRAALFLWLRDNLKKQEFVNKTMLADQAMLNASLLSSFSNEFSESEKLDLTKELEANVVGCEKQIDDPLWVRRQVRINYEMFLPIQIAFGKYVLSKQDAKYAKQKDESLDILNQNIDLASRNLDSNEGGNYANYLVWSAFVKLAILGNSENADAEIKTTIVQMKSALNKTSSNQLTKTSWVLYMSNLNTDLASWDFMKKDIIKLADKNSELMDLLIQYGYKPSNKK